MTFLQAYYTSCVSGLRGSKGFQFNAATPGLDPRLLDQLERLGMYAAPSTAAVQPSVAELARFPLVLLYQPLGGGQSVLAQSRYVGLDYSGRWGNYFTHYAITDDADRDLTGQLPIELWKSPAWTFAESPQPELPRLDEFPLSGIIDAEAIRSFVSERPHHVAGIVEATRLALMTGRRVVIVDDDESIAKWIAAATYALPRHLALATSFTTYTKSPYESGAIIIGTSADSDFRATQFEIDHQYSVFDFVRERFSRIDVSSRYPKGVARAWGESADRVANFPVFAQLVDPGVDAASVDQTWFGYALTDGRLEDAVTPADVTWLTARVEQFTAAQLSRVLTSVIGNGALSYELGEPLLQLYDRARRATVAVATAVEERIAPWLAQVAIREAERYSERLAALSPHSERIRSLVAQHLPQWLEAVDGASSAAQFAALLVTGEALGFALAEPRRTGAAAVRWIAAPFVQARVLALSRGQAGQELIMATVAGLRAVPAVVLQEIETWLRSEPVREVTREVVAESEDLGFYTRVLTVLERDPFVAFNTAVLTAKQLDGSVTPARIDEICGIVWLGFTPPARDVLRISERYPAQLPATKLLFALPPMLFTQGTPPGEIEQLASILAKTENRKALGNCFYPVAVYHARRALLHFNAADPFNPLEKAIALLGKWSIDPGAAAWLDDAISANLLSIRDPLAHAKYLAQAVAAHRDLLSNYARHAAERLRTSSVPVSTAAYLFRVWHRPSDAHDWLLAEVLLSQLHGWPRKRLDEVGSELARVDNATAAAWKVWRLQISEKKMTFFGGLFRRGRSGQGGVR